MAAIFVATIPLFSILIGHLWGLERMTVRGWAGLSLGAVGIVLLVGVSADTRSLTLSASAASAHSSARSRQPSEATTRMPVFTTSGHGR